MSPPLWQLLQSLAASLRLPQSTSEVYYGYEDLRSVYRRVGLWHNHWRVWWLGLQQEISFCLMGMVSKERLPMDWLTALIHRFSYISLEAPWPAPGMVSTYCIRSLSSTEPTLANGRPTMMTQRPRLSEKLIPEQALEPFNNKMITASSTFWKFTADDSKHKGTCLTGLLTSGRCRMTLQVFA